MKQEREVQIIKIMDESEIDHDNLVVGVGAHKTESTYLRKGFPWIRIIFFSIVGVLLIVSILTAQHFKKLRVDLIKDIDNRRYLDIIEIKEDKEPESRPKGEVINSKFDEGAATNEQLFDSAVISYKGKSGITYSFGVEGTNIEQGYYHGDSDVVSIALNPMVIDESNRRVGFFFLPNYGSMGAAIIGSKYTQEQLKEVNVAGFCQLNNQQAFNVRFQNNTEPGCHLTFFRGDKIYYTTDNWNCFVMAFDLDTQEVLDTLTLHIEELDSEGRPIDFNETILSGWWRITGVEEYKCDIVGDISAKSIGDAAISQHNSSAGVVGKNFSRVKELGDFPSMPKTDSYFVHQLRSGGYAPLILRYDTNKIPTPAVSSTDSLIAVTPLYRSINGEPVPLITLYGYMNLNADGNMRFVYVGYTDYNDCRCISLEYYEDIKLRWE